MSCGGTLSLEARIAALEEDNARLRTALAEAQARLSDSGHAFAARDALPLAEEGLQPRHAVVPGRVTVIVPAYDAERFIERAIHSVWAQSYPRHLIELLVVDDGSRDTTKAAAERLVGSSPVRMRLLMHDGNRNRGVAPTRQLAAREATGEFVALLDADDAFLPDRLAASVEALRADSALPAVCSLGRNVNEDGETVVGHNGTSRAGEWRTLDGGLEPPFTFEQLWRVDPIANSSLTVRRSALERVGGFPAVMAHQAEDWLLVLKLSLLGPIPCIERELMLYTHHDGAYTHAYHASNWREGARLEVFYHLAWWMLRSPFHAEEGARFFRREYPRQIAEHQRFLPLLREYYAAGGRPAAGAASLGDHLQRLAAELETLRRVVHVKLRENKRLRLTIAELQSAEAAPARIGGRRSRRGGIRVA